MSSPEALAGSALPDAESAAAVPCGAARSTAKPAVPTQTSVAAVTRARTRTMVGDSIRDDRIVNRQLRRISRRRRMSAGLLRFEEDRDARSWSPARAGWARVSVLLVEVLGENELQRQAVGGIGHAGAHAELHLEAAFGHVIDDAKDLVRLLGHRGQSADPSEVRVRFERQGPRLSGVDRETYGRH